MALNKHPDTIVKHFAQPFAFETPYQGRTESIPLLEVGYEAWGNPRHPAILVTHALSMNTHATDLASPHDLGSSWWGAMVGPGRVVDTDRYYVVCINMLGGCGGTSGPASMNPDTGEPYGLHFPIVTLTDMVRTQRMLLDTLGITRLHAVIGGSMGGFQSLVWAIQYPDFVERAILLGSSAYSNQFMIMTNRAQIDAIQRDANYREGRYHDGPAPEAGIAIARMIGFTTFISPIMMEKKFRKYHRSQREAFVDRHFHEQYLHEAEDYLHRVADPFSLSFDANSMIYLLQTWSHFDLAVKYGSLAQALAPIRSRVLLISATGDNLFPTYLSEDIVRAMQGNGQPVQHELIEEDYGHDFFLIPEIILEKLAPPLRLFLEE
ncbi:MAG TPA: homoserine O-acetyltransferase [bacterium]|nr:homoserine O-acetyltransferase [bacterium]